jgi:MFS family permease
MAAASVYGVEGLAGLFGRVVFGVLSDRFGPRRVIVAGLALQAVGIYSYIYVSQLTHFYILAVALGMVYGGVMPLYSVLAREYFGQRIMGTVLGAATMVSSFGMALGPIAGGWMYDTFGSYHWLYVSSAVIGLAAAGMALAFPPPGRTDAEEPQAQPA